MYRPDLTSVYSEYSVYIYDLTSVYSMAMTWTATDVPKTARYPKICRKSGILSSAVQHSVLLKAYLKNVVSYYITQANSNRLGKLKIQCQYGACMVICDELLAH